MITVLFEVTIRPEGKSRYLELAAGLAGSLAQAEGFLSSERFSSLKEEGKLLSLSRWESEEAVEKWRNDTAHRMSQRQGREELFESYTITVLSTLRSYTLASRGEAPEDSNIHFGHLPEPATP